MGYRGEDVSAANGDWGRQTPWQPSSGAAPGHPGAWDDGPPGYSSDANYPAVEGSGFGYGPDGGYHGQGQQGYGPPEGQYGSPYGQQPYGQEPYGQYDAGYRPEQGQGGAGGYDGPQGYTQHDGYGYENGQNPSPGYDQPPGYDQGGYDQGGYDQRPAPGYGPGGGYQDANAGYGQPDGYPLPPVAPRGRAGGYPALPSGAGGPGGYPTEDAGNDWYGEQPAAANGASFADTGTYALNGRVIDEYGTGPRGALRDPVRGYPPGPGQQGSGPLPLNPAPSGPQPYARSGPQPMAETRAQARLDERTALLDTSYQEPGTRPGRAASDGFQGTGGRDAFNGRDEYNDYEDGFNDRGTADDPYQDRYGDDTGSRAGGGGRGPDKTSGRRFGGGPLSGKRLLFAAIAVVLVGVIGVAAYVFVINPSSSTSNPNAQGPLPTSSAEPSQQACVKELGTYCHIENATDDPTPLTVAELFLPSFTNETDKTSYQLVSTKLDKTCANAVIGQDLITALKNGKCTQVLRGSYVSGNGQIMGTIGVANLSTTNDAHYAGKIVGQNDFIAPLTSAKGVASKLGNGTGVVEAEYKGHYLILTWSEFVNGTDPTTKAEDNQLEQFSNDLVAGTANIDLSQRMVTGTPASSSSTS
jgi:hypothetical protein